MRNRETFKARLTICKEGMESVVLPQIVDFYKGNWILDVGCNTGTFIECLLEKFPECNILAFEPVKKYYKYTLKKFKDMDNVFVENLALGDRNEKGVIHVAQDNPGWNTFVVDMVDEDNKNTVENVSIMSFDNYLDYTGLEKTFDIVKIDTEGYEFKVLSGMHHFLRDQKPIIICEIGWGVNHPNWDEELEAFEYLYRIGYVCANKDEIATLQETKDFLFVPRSD